MPLQHLGKYFYELFFYTEVNVGQCLLKYAQRGQVKVLPIKLDLGILAKYLGLGQCAFDTIRSIL